MVTYRKCPECGTITKHIEYVQCVECGTIHKPGRRSTSPTVQIGFEPHFNRSIGAYVSTEHEMHDKAARIGAKRGNEIKMRKW